MKEEDIYKKIEQLNHKQAITFGLTCFYRTKHFYQSFESNNDLSKVDSIIGNGNCLNYIEFILGKLNDEEIFPYNFPKKDIDFFELAIVDDDYFGSSVENFSAQLTAIIANDILEYSHTLDKECIKNCVGSMLEIINQNRSDMFFNSPNKSPKIELEFYLE